MSSSQGANSSASPLRLLSPLGAVAIIVGIVIGAGIFKTPSMVAGIAGDVLHAGSVVAVRTEQVERGPQNAVGFEVGCKKVFHTCSN